MSSLKQELEVPLKVSMDLEGSKDLMDLINKAVRDQVGLQVGTPSETYLKSLKDSLEVVVKVEPEGVALNNPRLREKIFR